MRSIGRARCVRGSLPFLLLVLAGTLGCDWVEKTIECQKLTKLSSRWGNEGDRFGTRLESHIEEQLASLETFDPSSRPDLVRASRDLHRASDTLDVEVEGFFRRFSSDFESLPLRDAKLARLRDRYVDHAGDVDGRIHELTGSIRHLGNLFANLYPSLITTERAALEIERQMTDAEQRITRAQRRLDESATTEERIIGQINSYCMLPGPPAQG